MYTKSLERLKGIVDPADKVPIEKFLSVENLRLAIALIFSLKINFYLTNHRVDQGEFVGVGRKMWNFACNADKGTDTDHTHSAYTDTWKIGHIFSTSGALAYMFGHVTLAQHALAIGGIEPDQDLVVRICQPPASTRKVCNVVVVGRKIAASAYGLVVPFEIIDVFVQAQAYMIGVAEMPWAYHIGAGFLMSGAIPGERLEQPPLDEDMVQWFVQFVNGHWNKRKGRQARRLAQA
jgi:hypothetical protein